MTGFLWKSKIHKKKTRGNQTPGNMKGENCRTNYMDGYMAKSSRSYKHRDYGAWLTKMARRRGEVGGTTTQGYLLKR